MKRKKARMFSFLICSLVLFLSFGTAAEAKTTQWKNMNNQWYAGKNV